MSLNAFTELTMQDLKSTPPQRGAMSINQFCDWAGIGRTKYYELVSCKEITPRRIGGKPVILMRDAEDWLAALPEAA